MTSTYKKPTSQKNRDPIDFRHRLLILANNYALFLVQSLR